MTADLDTRPDLDLDTHEPVARPALWEIPFVWTAAAWVATAEAVKAVGRGVVRVVLAPLRWIGRPLGAALRALGRLLAAPWRAVADAVATVARVVRRLLSAPLRLIGSVLAALGRGVGRVLRAPWRLLSAATAQLGRWLGRITGLALALVRRWGRWLGAPLGRAATVVDRGRERLARPWRTLAARRRRIGERVRARLGRTRRATRPPN